MSEYTIKDFNDFIKQIDSYKGNYVFRGQRNIGWGVIPSAFREPKVSLSCERDSLKEADPVKDIEKVIFEQQHNNSHTRICDFSMNPLVALYFACEISDDSADGVVYILKKDLFPVFGSSERVIFDKILKTSVSSFSELEIDRLSTSDIIGVSVKNYFLSRDCYNERAYRQGGTGVIFGFGESNGNILSYTTPYLNSDLFEKIVIPLDLKKDILEEIHNRGYEQNILYCLDLPSEMAESVELKEETFDSSIILGKTKLYKVITELRVSALYYKQEDLNTKIFEYVSNLKKRYGEETKVYLFVFYSDEDYKRKNWICRYAPWIKGSHLEYTKDYLDTRSYYANNEVSEVEAVQSHKSLLDNCKPVYEELKWLYEQGLNQETLTDFIEKNINIVDDNNNQIKRLFPRSDAIDKITQNARLFVDGLYASLNEAKVLMDSNDNYSYRLNYWLSRCSNFLNEFNAEYEKYVKQN
jgi:hypothetical protein